MSFKPKITTILIGDVDTIETKVPKTLLPKVIESELPKLETLFLKIIEPKEPHPSSPNSLGPSSSLPLSQTKPIYLGPGGGPLPHGLLSIEQIP